MHEVQHKSLGYIMTCVSQPPPPPPSPHYTQILCHRPFKNVVVMDGVSERDRGAAVRAGLRVYAFMELEGIGAAHKHAHRPPAANDVATFC